jgi:ankyrin repeat protein
MIELAPPVLESPPIPPKVLEEDDPVDLSGGIRISIAVDVRETDQMELVTRQSQKLADGYSEYTRSFGSPFLANTSSDRSTSCDFLLPAKLLVGESAHLSESSDKEVVPDNWSPVSPTTERVEVTQASENLAVSASPSTGTGFGESELANKECSELEVVPAPTRWDANDFGPVRTTIFDDNSDNSLPATRQTLSSVNSPGTHRGEAQITTEESDMLALQRVRATPTSCSMRQKRNSTIGTALRVVRKKTMYLKSRPADPDKATSGYLYTALAEALQDAVAEQNMPLIASLFNLGANVNYSSVKDRVYHNILQVAVASGNAQIVDCFITMGADGVSVDNAVITAFFADYLDLAIKLAPHASIQQLHPFDTPGPQYQKLSASSLGRIIRDRTMPSESRARLVECFTGQKYFDANKVVFQVYDTANERLFEFSTLSALVSHLDIERVEKILPGLGTVRRHTLRHTLTDRVHNMGAICCIRPSHWQLSPDTALAMLQILIHHSAEVGDLAYWPGQGAMSPLACAVAGGGLEGVSFLLGLDADPECLVYQLQENGKETEGYSALGWAALHGRLDICTLLVDAGATPWRTSFKGYTPLYLACTGGHIEVIEYLLSLDVERSMVDNCLLAAVKGDEPRSVEVLLKVGASITPDTWIEVMARQPKPRQRGKLLEIIDLLLSQPSIILEEPVLAAIDSGNFAGLSRILERRNGALDFDKNAVFGNWRWAPGRGGVDCRDRSCLYYADSRQARDFVALLMSYGWVNNIGPWPARQPARQAGYSGRQ